MKNILNVVFNVLKFILYFVSISLSFYIILTMYKRIDRNIIEAFTIFIPYIVLIVLFVINILFKQKNLTNNIFYNITCCLVLLTTVLVCIRTMFDKQMILNTIMGYNINFSYFNDYIPFMNIMMYGLIISNVLLMIRENEKPIAKKIDVEIL